MGKFENKSGRWLASIQQKFIARTLIECSLVCMENHSVSYAYNRNTMSCLISDEPTTSSNDILGHYSVHEDNTYYDT